jgi:hypothetical protein
VLVVAAEVLTVSLYEALSLVVSSVGTLGTVVIGLRQLRQSARPVPQPAYHPPVPAHPGRAPAYHPSAPYGPYGPAHQPPPASQPSPAVRPTSVTAASLVLFVAASTHPLVVAVYYAIRFATTPQAAAAELGGEGVIDLLVFGGIAFLSALLGVFVTRRSRVALWSVRVLGTVSALLLGLLLLAAALSTLAPETNLTGFDLMFLGYLTFVLAAYAVAAVLLVTAGARAFFRPVR